MHSLVGCFLKEEPAEKIDGQSVLPFTLVLSATKFKKFFTHSKEEYQSWISYIKRTIGYASLLDFYELKVRLCVDVLVGKFRQGKVWDSERRDP